MPIISSHVVWQDVPGELALFDGEAQAYHCLGPIASDIWRAIAAGRGVDTLVADLAERFDAPPDRISRDVQAFIDDAVAKRLLVRGADA